jgi:hypothetical protein
VFEVYFIKESSKFGSPCLGGKHGCKNCTFLGSSAVKKVSSIM